MAYLIKRSFNARYCAMLSVLNRPPRFLASWRDLGQVRLGIDDVPKNALLESSHRRLPDFIYISPRFSMSKYIRDLLLSLEAEIGQFFPVEIRREKEDKPILNRHGLPLTEPYYIYNPLTRLDSINVERSILKVRPYTTPDGRTEAFVDDTSVGGTKRLLLRSDVINGHHFWQVNLHMRFSYFISDIFWNHINEKIIRALKAIMYKRSSYIGLDVGRQ